MSEALACIVDSAVVVPVEGECNAASVPSAVCCTGRGVDGIAVLPHLFLATA